MNLLTIAFNNLIRRKSKTAFIVAGLLIGITASVALLSIAQSMKKDIQNKLEKYGANIIITPKKDELPLTYGSVTLPGVKFEKAKNISENDILNIKKLKNGKDIKIISPKLIEAVKIKGSKLIMVGLNFKLEKNLKSWWELKGRYPNSDNEVILGSEVSKKTGLKQGDKTTIKGRLFTVSGILKETGSSDDSALFADLKISQSLFNKKNSASIIETAVEKDSVEIEKVASEINKHLPYLQASTIKEALKSQGDNVKMFTWFSLISSAIILFVASLIVFITMMSSVNERTREIGIFRAIGFRKTHVIKIIIIEAACVSFAGGLLGSFFGYGLAVLILPKISKNSGALHLNILLLLSAICLAVILGILSSIIPAKKAADLDPAEALRFI